MRKISIRLRTSNCYLAGGLFLGAAIGILGLVFHGEGLGFFLHARTSQVGLPLSLALIGAGATLRRLEHRERASASHNAAVELTPDHVVRESTIPERGARRDLDRAL